MKWLTRIGIGLGALALTLLLAVGLLVGTTPGLHLLLNAAPRWVPGLAIGSVDGGWRDLTLKQLRYQMPGVTAELGELHLALRPGCLWRGRLCVDDLALRDVSVAVDSRQLPPSAPQTTTDEATAELSTPLDIALTRLALNNVQVTMDDSALSLASLQTGLSWQGKALTVTPTHIAGLRLTLPPSAAAAEPAPAQPLGERLQALFAKPLLADMPDVTLPLDLTVSDISAEQISVGGGQDLAITRLQLQAEAKQQRVALQRLAVQTPQGALFAQGEVALAGQWPLTFNLNGIVNAAPLQGERLKLTMQGALREQLKLALNLSGPQRGQLDVTTELAQAGLPLNVALRSQQLRWPLTGAAQYQLNDVNFSFSGKMTDYVLALRGGIGGSALPPGNLLLDAKGDAQQLALQRLRLEALKGYGELSGQLDWRDAISWNTRLALQGIDAAAQWPDLPLRLNGDMVTEGQLKGADWQLKVPRLQLDGSVRQNKLSARGALDGNSAGQVHINGLTLALGRNQLSVNGELADRWNLNGDINAPALNGMLPGLAGRVMGTLKLTGQRDAPQLDTKLTASGLRWQDLSLSQLDLDGNLHMAQQLQGALNLKLRQLKQGDVQLSALTLRADGNESRHQLRLTMDGQPVSGQLALSGSFDRAQQRWRGTLNDTRFDTPVGEWRLAPSMTLDYQAALQKVTVGAHCWRNPKAELCATKPIEAGASGQASVALNRFDLAMLAPLLGADTVLNGNVTGNGEVSWQANGGLPQARLALNGQGVNLRQQLNGNTLPVAFDALTLNAALERGQARLNWNVALHGNGRFNGEVLVTDPQRSRRLGGTVTINNISLDLLNPALAKGEKAAGLLNANLRLAGDAQRPQLFGQLLLERLDVDGNWMPVDLDSGRLALVFNGMSSTLQGVLKTTHGQLNLTGNADWSRIDAWRAQVAAQGDRVRVTVPPMVRMDVSPDIQLEATPQALTLNGSVSIPWARIQVQEMPESAVGVSSDEVMLDEHRQPLQTASASIPIHSNLTVRVGNDVRLDAYGLRARLQGELKVAQDEHGLGLNGQINIPNGRFKAYGQDLIVRKGILLFAGPPAQPTLNIEAIRNPDNTEDDVVAGVRITGSASAPKLEVFSEPTLSQQEALSYLLRGQGLESSGSDSNMMTSALIGLGVAQSGQLVGKIGEAFGVSNLALDTQGVGDSSQVVVSGYVLPGLQVKYGVGIFDSLATLTLRYRLMPKLYLEAVSGVAQALDVLYQFEF